MADVKRFSKLKSSFLVVVVTLWPGVAFSNPSVDSLLNHPEVFSPTAMKYRTRCWPIIQIGRVHATNLGGTGADGVDCSSFIQALFYDKFQLQLPRSSREQMAMGERVDVSDLRSGDLLFFRTGPTRRHVGVYVGNNQFMHVSTRAGVEIAKLLSPYWQRHLITARRVGLLGIKPSN